MAPIGAAASAPPTVMSSSELPSNIATFVLRRSWEDVYTESVFHVWQEGPHSPATLDVLAGAFKSWWNTGGGIGVAGPSAFDPVPSSLGRSAALSLIGRVKAAGLSVVTSWLSASLAAEANVPAPQAAAVVRWFTGWRGRGRTGRTYHGLVTDGMYEGEREGVLKGGVRDGLTIAYQLLISTLTTATGVPGEFAPVLVHRRPVHPSDSDSGLWDFIRDARVEDLRVRTQRRRVPRQVAFK